MVHAVNSKTNQEKSAIIGNFIDIPEHKQIDQVNEEIRPYIQLFLDIVHEPIVALDADLKVISANGSFYEIFLLEPDQTEGQLIYELGNGHWDSPKLHEFLEDLLPESNIICNFEIEHKFEGGERGVLVLNGRRLVGKENKTQMIILAIKKINGQIELMDDNEESFHYLKETLESTDDGILVIDMEDKIKIYNQRFVGLLEIPEHIIATKDYNKVMKFIVDQLTDSKRFLDIIDELNTNHSIESFDIVETKNKTILEYYSKPQWIGGEIVGRVWSFRDITSRKWAEKALRITYISFHNILESSTDGIIVVDKKGTVCFFNHAAEAMFQKNIDDQLSEMLNFPVTLNEIKEIEIERLEVGPGIAEMRIVETEWEGKAAYLAMLRDITDRKNAEEELKKHQEHLEEEVKQRTNELIQAEKMVALGQLVSGVAHEVNNPLAFIRANTEFIKDMISELKKQFKKENLSLKNLDEIENLIKVNLEGINRISTITTALKRFAKPGSEDKSLADVNQGIKDTLLIVGNKLKHRIKVHDDYGELPELMCNIEHLNQVFMNVILNAAEAMDEGNLCIKTWNESGKIYIEIQDDGIGIPEDDITKIFDPFFTTKDNGTGLGLSLSFRIIQAHGGNIQADSSVGKGTKIKIELPVVDENDRRRE
jgi:signal transduction histidine kinase